MLTDHQLSLLLLVVKTAVATFCLFLVFSNTSFSGQSQDFYSSPTYVELRGDYNQVSVVARVMVEDTVALEGHSHDYEFAARGKVIEAFKGGLRAGQSIEFFVRAEQGYDHKAQRGDWIVFLIQRLDKQTGKPSYHELENSIHPYSKSTVAKLRRLRRTHSHLPSSEIKPAGIRSLKTELARLE